MIIRSGEPLPRLIRKNITVIVIDTTGDVDESHHTLMALQGNLNKTTRAKHDDHIAQMLEHLSTHHNITTYISTNTQQNKIDFPASDCLAQSAIIATMPQASLTRTISMSCVLHYGHINYACDFSGMDCGGYMCKYPLPTTFAHLWASDTNDKRLEFLGRNCNIRNTWKGVTKRVPPGDHITF